MLLSFRGINFVVLHGVKRIALISVLVIATLSITAHGSQEIERKKVLVLLTFRPTLPVSIQYDHGIRSIFNADTWSKTVLNIEFMDMTHFVDGDHSRRLRDVYMLKYSEPKPDLIIAVAQPAVEFVLEYKQDLFPDTPVVFGGIEKNFAETRLVDSGFTGHLTGIAYTETLDFAIELQPDTRHVVVYGGVGPIARGLAQTCREAYRSYEDRLDITYLLGLPMKVLLERMAKLPERTIAIHLPLWRDGAGKEFVGNESLAMVASSANAPVYTFWDVAIGTGIVGGYVNNLEEEAKAIARLGLRILGGERPENIPIEPAPSFQYIVDWRQLKRWSISENRLPSVSIIKFKELTTWERHKGRIIGALAIIILQTLVIGLLLHQHRSRRKAQYRLRERLKFENQTAEMSSDLLNIASGEVDDRIMDVLSWTGQFLKADRCHMFRFNWQKTKFRITHLWQADGIPQDRVVTGGMIVKSTFPWLSDRLLSGNNVTIDDVEMLSGEESIHEYQYCQSIGIRSFIILPIQVAHAPLCAIGLDSMHQKRRWPQTDRDRLRIIGDILTNAVFRHHAQKDAEAAAFRYRTVADYTYDWEYWELDNGSMEYVSPSCERISGYAVNEFKDRPSLLQEIILPEDRDIWEKHRYSAADDGLQEAIQFRIRRKDGQIRWIEHVCQRVKSTKHALLGIRASNRDITDRKLAELEAQKHREQLTYISRVTTMGEFSASLAHELNQPLTAIRNNANAALRYLDIENRNLDEIGEILNDIIEDDRRAAGIIKKLRSLMSKKELVFSALNINSIVKSVVKLANREVFTRDINLVLELAEILPPVRGDTIHLEQLILNLVLNAVESMDSCERHDRTLTVRTVLHDNKHATVSVTDKGTGLDEKRLQRIFEPFYTTKSTGMGIGLSICRSIAEAHGGRLWAKNNLDRGATFSFSVPISTEEAV